MLLRFRTRPDVLLGNAAPKGASSSPLGQPSVDSLLDPLSLAQIEIPSTRSGALPMQPVVGPEVVEQPCASFQLISSAPSGFVTRVVTCWRRYRCKMGRESGRREVRGCSQDEGRIGSEPK